MRKTFIRHKENAAKHDLLTIDEQQTIKELEEAYDPFKIKVSIEPQKKKIGRKKVKTEVSSPRKRSIQYNLTGLKQNLERLRKDSLRTEVSQQEKENPKQTILRNLHVSRDSGRSTVNQIYKNKQKSEEKMRPLVIIQNSRNQQEEEEKIRSLIKRKILAKDLFRKATLTRTESSIQKKVKENGKQSQLSKVKSEKNGMKKNLIFNSKQRHYLPHIF